MADAVEKWMAFPAGGEEETTGGFTLPMPPLSPPGGKEIVEEPGNQQQQQGWWPKPAAEQRGSVSGKPAEPRAHLQFPEAKKGECEATVVPGGDSAGSLPLRRLVRHRRGWGTGESPCGCI